MAKSLSNFVTFEKVSFSGAKRIEKVPFLENVGISGAKLLENVIWTASRPVTHKRPNKKTQ